MNKAPNFLFIQADQLSARTLPCYGNTVAKTPNIDSLAAQGTVFDYAYCNYPLCAPSRFSMMSGLLATTAGAYDNGAEFPASLPTFAHYLRLLGYQTCLSGKMHFIGPDQLHGFEERLTTDIYPSDFNWTANWDQPKSNTDSERLLAAAGEVNGVLQAGIYERTIQMDFDDEVGFKAVRKIHDLSRSEDTRPFCLFVSFTHPHDPFAVPRRYWDRYRHEDIDMPTLPAMPREDLDPHSQRLYDHIGVADTTMTEEQVRNARHAYYGAISYIDDHVGSLLNALQSSGFHENTFVILISDHGEALGERGLWFKRSFFDCAMRVPLIVSSPALPGESRCDKNVSLIDLLPTVIDLADTGNGLNSIKTPYDGRSLRPLIEGGESEGPNQVFAELTSEAMEAPGVMVLEDRYKYIHCDTDPPQLYDLNSDPHETKNLAGRADTADIQTRLADIVKTNWNMEELKHTITQSQRRRRIVDKAHALGASPSWDHDTVVPGKDQYFRPCEANPGASNYNSQFQVRMKPDSEEPNLPEHP